MQNNATAWANYRWMAKIIIISQFTSANLDDMQSSKWKRDVDANGGRDGGGVVMMMTTNSFSHHKI